MTAVGAEPGSAPVVRTAASAPSSAKSCSAVLAALARSQRKAW